MTDAPMGAPPSEAGAREDLFMAGAIVKMAQLALSATQAGITGV